MSYRCNRCGENFCSNHRLPESHRCPTLAYEKLSKEWFRDKEGSRGEPVRLGSSESQRQNESVRGKESSEAESTSEIKETKTDSGKMRYKGSRRDESKQAKRPTPSLSSLAAGIQSFRQKLKRRQTKVRWKVRQSRRRWRHRRRRFFAVLWKLTKLSIAVFVLISVATFSLGLLDGSAFSETESIESIVGANSTKSTPIADDSTVIQSEKKAGYVSSDDLDKHRVELLIHERVNKERQKRDLSPIEYDIALQEIARYHSKDMAENDYFSHDSPSGETFGDRYEKFGYDCRVPVGDNVYMTGSENIAQTYYLENLINGDFHSNEQELANGLMNQWMNSTGHRENILTPEWDDIGVGVHLIEDENGTAVYATQNFC